LGLGVGQYLNKKKIQMLGNPVDYLTNCNTALAAVGGATTNAYDAKLDALVDSIAGPVLAHGGLVTAAHVNAWNAEHLAVRNLLGWCWQREKIDWQEARKFDCQLVRTIFSFLLSLVNFHKSLASGQKIKF